MTGPHPAEAPFRDSVWERNYLMEPTRNTPRATYWHPIRLAALSSLFSFFALVNGDLIWLPFLLFLVFLLPIPARPRTLP